MGTPEIPNILIIDDHPEEHRNLHKLRFEESNKAKVNTKHPQAVELEDLLTAQLVLVDNYLDSWPERDGLAALSCKPADGLALASVLRRHLHNREQDSPTAFALYTGKIEDVASPFPPDYREHALAGINNLEWVFQKAKPGADEHTTDQIVELASSVLRLPQNWPSDSSEQPMRQLAGLLGIQFEDEANELLLEDVAACLPPIHELSQWSHGLAVLRWLLQRILPFPCFLWDTYRLAARFRVDHSALCDALKGETPLQEKLSGCRYKGVLADFLGPRWWRSKVELFLWEFTDGNSSDVEVVQAAIRQAANDNLLASQPPDHPIVCVNSHYQPLETFYRMEQAVRIRPDDWPAYADQAWTTIELAKSEPKLRSLVIREDLELLG
jgi:hypothetical protein